MKSDARILIEILGLAKKVLQKKLEPHQKSQSALEKLKTLYGDDEEILSYQIDRYLEVLRKFVDRFGEGPVILMRIPSRICIIGGHTDYLTDPGRYLLGHVITFANPRRDMLVAIRFKKKGTFRLSSTHKRFKDKRFKISDLTEELRKLSVSRQSDDEKTKRNRQVLRNRSVSDFKKFWLAYLDLLQIERKARRELKHSSKH